MDVRSILLIAIGSFLRHDLLWACTQDLFRPSQTSQGGPPSSLISETDRSLPPAFTPSRSFGETPVDLEASASLTWDSFDFQKAFRSTFTKNIREELFNQSLSAVTKELAASPLVLACQVSPTVCDALKHYRQTAHQMIGMDLDVLQAIEGIAQDSTQALRAKAVKDCLIDKIRQGTSARDALRQCSTTKVLKTLSGGISKGFDLLKEVSSVLRLSPQAGALLKELGQGIEITPTGIKAHVKLNLLGETYTKAQNRYQTSWEGVLRQIAGGRWPDPDQIRRLTPPHTSPLAEEELLEIAHLPDPRRNALVSSLSTAASLVELSRNVHEVERALEAAHYSAANHPAIREELQKQREALRAELSRLTDEYEHQRRFNNTLLEMQGRAILDTQMRANQTLDRNRLSNQQEEKFRSSMGWGSLPPERKALSTGTPCRPCDVPLPEFHFGKIRK